MNKDIHDYNERARISGHINFQYAFLDYLTSNIIWHLLKIDKTAGIIVTGSLDIRPKLNMAIELSDHYSKISDVRDYLKTMKNRAESKNGFISSRNIIVHGIYFSREGDSTIMVESHRNKRTREKQVLDIEFIQKTLDEITKVAKELAELMDKNGINIH